VPELTALRDVHRGDASSDVAILVVSPDARRPEVLATLCQIGEG
jgi:hypothetical protein